MNDQLDKLVEMLLNFLLAFSAKPKQPFQPKVRINEDGEEVKEVEPANDEVDMLDGLVCRFILQINIHNKACNKL